MSKIKWLGYKHISGTYHLRRYFSHIDIAEAHASPYVSDVFGPWEADTREAALRKLKEEVGDKRR